MRSLERLHALLAKKSVINPARLEVNRIAPKLLMASTMLIFHASGKRAKRLDGLRMPVVVSQ